MCVCMCICVYVCVCLIRLLIINSYPAFNTSSSGGTGTALHAHFVVQAPEMTVTTQHKKGRRFRRHGSIGICSRLLKCGLPWL